MLQIPMGHLAPLECFAPDFGIYRLSIVPFSNSLSLNAMLKIHMGQFLNILLQILEYLSYLLSNLQLNEIAFFQHSVLK